MTKPSTYTRELREEAVKLFLVQGLTLGEAPSIIAADEGWPYVAGTRESSTGPIRNFVGEAYHKR